MRPNFMLIGAAKCATTAIAALVGKHPDVFMIDTEHHFFSKDEVFGRGLAWFESLFDAAGSRRAIGEHSNTYTMKEAFPHARGRIVAYERDLRLIYVVREPLARIESFWIESRSWWPEELVHHDFNTAIARDRHWLVDSSNYLRQIEEYRRYYPDGRILVLFYDDFRADPAGFMRRCFEFLDVDPEAPLEGAGGNPNPRESKRLVRPIQYKLRRYPAYRLAMRMVPGRYRWRFSQALFRVRAPGRLHWTPESRRFVLDVLRDDTLRFLERYGKPRDFWKSLEVAGPVLRTG